MPSSVTPTEPTNTDADSSEAQSDVQVLPQITGAYATLKIIRQKILTQDKNKKVLRFLIAVSFLAY